jgi:hypothetical protein
MNNKQTHPGLNLGMSFMMFFQRRRMMFYKPSLLLLRVPSMNILQTG